MAKQYVINADDFGMYEKCTNAILESFEKGLIDTTTMMVTGAYFDRAVASAKEKGLEDRIGLHLNLAEGTPLTEPIKKEPFFCENGVYHGKVSNRLPNKREREALRTEIRAQIGKFLASGLPLHHLDSHEGIHLRLGVLPTVVDECKRHHIGKIRVRAFEERASLRQKILSLLVNAYVGCNGLKYTDKMGSFDSAVSCDVSGTVEVMCHPDYNKEGMLIDRIGGMDSERGKPLEEQYRLLQNKVKI